jgi:hypothetical protein
MTWYKSESAVKPEKIDTTSSKIYNYVRKNIVQEERTYEGHEPVVMYVYDECIVPKASWDVFLQQEQNTANIDFMAMELGIDLEV